MFKASPARYLPERRRSKDDRHSENHGARYAARALAVPRPGGTIRVKAVATMRWPAMLMCHASKASRATTSRGINGLAFRFTRRGQYFVTTGPLPIGALPIPTHPAALKRAMAVRATKSF